MNRLFFTAWLGTLILTSCASEIKNRQSDFIGKITTQYPFKEKEIKNWLDHAEINADILKKIAKPAETLPWYRYRTLFITQDRIIKGVEFWQKHQATLTTVEQRYGVPAEIIVAIIGVETFYGQQAGKYRVIDALSTLAFAYPPRSRFFQSELEQYLVLCQEEQINPLTVKGSYAGAMGIPQFMPSSFRHFAVDFDQNNHRDIWKSASDSIASIANYLAQNHWQRGQTIAVTINNPNNTNTYKSILNKDLTPNLTQDQLESLGLVLSQRLPTGHKIKLLAFELASGTELWATLDNFYAITRYNQSPLYALAVFQLSQAILEKKNLSQNLSKPDIISPACYNDNCFSDSILNKQ